MSRKDIIARGMAGKAQSMFGNITGIKVLESSISGKNIFYYSYDNGETWYQICFNPFNITIEVEDWDTETNSYVLENYNIDLDNLQIMVPAPTTMENGLAIYNSKIFITEASETSITLTCETIPSVDVTISIYGILDWVYLLDSNSLNIIDVNDNNILVIPH